MQPPVTSGTILQNRYRIISVLGQGGFGRTYLAEDQGRFNELCALKELIPIEESAYVLEKSKELFQREAAILYQIQHPQIPQFQATLEQEGRLFLVQAYVGGSDFSTILKERKALGTAFSEAEVFKFLQQILPVLGHIHSKKIIHRDISPDNIILRESDRLPVLIDFGVVKELATRFQLSTLNVPFTTVGKPGYAPSEQLKTGRAYPSSDLYALAVTAIVLFTGKEPETLFNDIELSWEWQQWVRVNAGLAQVLNRMLSYKPRDRYQSAEEVLESLEQLSLPVHKHQPRMPDNISEMHTLAVGRGAKSRKRYGSRRYESEPVMSESSRSSIWEDPLAIIPLVIGLILLAGFGSWAMVNFIFNNRREVAISPSPIDFPNPVVKSLTPQTPTPTPTIEPESEELNLSVGQPVSQEGFLRVEEAINYTFQGEEGQQLDASLSGEGVLMTLLGIDKTPISDRTERVLGWRGKLPATGQYTIQIKPIKGVASSNYKLDASLSNPASASPTPIPTITINPTLSPTVPLVSDIQPLSFAPGEDTVQVASDVSPQNIKRYLVNAQEGQILTVTVEQGAATFDLRSPEGQLADNAAGVRVWNLIVPRGGEYQIDVKASEQTNFTMNVSLRN